MNNNIKIINCLSILALLLFFGGQGVWLYHVREMKVKEFRIKAGNAFTETIQKYITDEGIKKMTYGEGDSLAVGELGKDIFKKCLSVAFPFEFSEMDLQLIYDLLYDHQDFDVAKVDTLSRYYLKKRGLPSPACWVISDRDRGTLLLTCGKVSRSEKMVQSVPVELGCGCRHQLIAFFKMPFVLRTSLGVLVVEGIFLMGFVLSLLWQWYYIYSFRKEAEVKILGSAHLEHELKKPIAILLNALEELIGNGNKALTEREQLKLKMMRVRLIKMANLTDTLLTICGNTSLRLECGPFDVRREMEMVRDIFNTLKPYALISFRIAPEAESALLDEVYFGHMVCNLVDNAIKYSGDHPFVTIDCWKENNNFVLAVRDNGIGIPKREQKRIFRAFYRTNNRCVYRTTGFGLGLAFVRRVVDCYGGDIQVESKVGAGSSFIIVLPQ